MRLWATTVGVIRMGRPTSCAWLCYRVISMQLSRPVPRQEMMEIAAGDGRLCGRKMLLEGAIYDPKLGDDFIVSADKQACLGPS